MKFKRHVSKLDAFLWLKSYQELGLESLKSRRWFRRLFYFSKIKNHGLSGSQVIILDIVNLHVTEYL